MRIAYHIGAHCTDEGRLLKSLLKNVDALSGKGIHIPGPGKYRDLLREAIQKTTSAPPAEGTREVLLDAIIEDENAEALVLSYERFICFPKRIFENGEFLQLTNEKVAGMRALFPQDKICYFMALRNPATYIPAVLADQNDLVYDAFMRGFDPAATRWSDVVTRIRETDPEAEITLWCDEDTPLIWAHLVRLIAGIDPMERISGGFDLLQALITEDGMHRFATHMRSEPPRTERQKRSIIARYLEEHAKPGALSETVVLPGWDQALVDRLTALYDEDVARLVAMDGVKMILP